MTWLFLWRGREGALEELGLDERARRADIKIGPLKHRSGDMYEFWDCDPADLAFIQCHERVEVAWCERFPDEAHLAHAAFGKWCDFWLSSDLRSVWDLLRANDAEGLRRMAEDYVAAEFGLLRGPTISESPDVPIALSVT